MNSTSLTELKDIKHTVTVPSIFSNEDLDTLKNSICKGLTDSEFKIFVMACNKAQLDPFSRQIHAVKRKSKLPSGGWGETMTVQTGIDGYRLIADRTGKYSPGREPTYVYDAEGKLLSSTAYVKKMTLDGTWHEVAATAFFSEYCQYTTDFRSGERTPSSFWAKNPHGQLAKCAESLAIRKAFPNDTSGIYTSEEMQQAESVHHRASPHKDTVSYVSDDQIFEISMILMECEPSYQDSIRSYLDKTFGGIQKLPSALYDRLKSTSLKNKEANSNKKIIEYSEISSTGV